MFECECEVLSIACTLDGEVFIQVQLFSAESWYYCKDASLGGCPLAPIIPWTEESSPYPTNYEVGPTFIQGFHLLRPAHVSRFSPGARVVFRPGMRRFP